MLEVVYVSGNPYPYLLFKGGDREFDRFSLDKLGRKVWYKVLLNATSSRGDLVYIHADEVVERRMISMDDWRKHGGLR